MKLKCPLSGVTYNGPGFDLKITFDVPHPIFSLDSGKLIGELIPRFAKDQLSELELHLFGTYLLKQLPIESWGFALLDKESLNYWTPFWLAHIQSLSSVVLRLAGRSPRGVPTFQLYPSYAEEGQKPLFNLKEWITTANAALDEYYAPISKEARELNRQFRANISDTQFSSEEQCNSVIEKALRGSLLSSREADKFPELIANWASKVGCFPSTVFRDAKGKKKTIRDHWKEILINAFDQGTKGEGYSNVLTSEVTIGDIEELEEHCATHIPVGTLHSAALYKELKALKEVILEFRSPAKAADLAIEILTSGDIASILGEVSHLPPVRNKEHDDPLAPRKEDYPSLSSFLKAKLAYKGGAE